MVNYVVKQALNYNIDLNQTDVMNSWNANIIGIDVNAVNHDGQTLT